MTIALKEHLKESEQKRGRVTELEQSIKDNENQLSELEKEYKIAVIEDSPNIDDLFREVESLQDKLKADNHKLKTLKAVTDEHLKASAINVLNAFPSDVSLVYKNKVDKVSKKIEQAKKDYINEVVALQNEVKEINKSKNKKAREYGQVMKSNHIKNNDINGTLYRELDDATHGVFKDIPAEVATVLISDIEGAE